MALILHLKYAENLLGRADRLAKVSFRGELENISVCWKIFFFFYSQIINEFLKLQECFCSLSY